MNNKGKGNSMYILIVPLVLIGSVLIIDTIIRNSQIKSFKTITEEVVEEVTNNEQIQKEEYYDGIKKAYERRGYETERLIVEINDEKFYVENEHNYFNLLSSFRKTTSEETVQLFGIEFLTLKLKKNSKTFVKVNIEYDENNKLLFEYTE